MKRHARSHGNERLKAQRMHFAHARKHPYKQETETLLTSTQMFSLRSSKPEPQQAPTSDCRNLASHTPAPIQEQVSHKPRHRSLNIAETQNSHLVTASDPDDFLANPRHENRFDVCKRALNSRKGRETGSTRLMPASMDAMKKKLLAQPDWLGLSTHRPAEIDYSSMKSGARVGRHRRINRSAECNTSKQPLSHESQRQNRVRSVTGKRKRSNQEKTSQNVSDQECDKFRDHPPTLITPAKPQRLHRTDICQPTGVAASRAYEAQPRTPLKDSNRLHYYLSDQGISLDDRPTDLVSLEEVRTLQNFDAVKGLHLQLRKNRPIINNEHSYNVTRENCQPPSSSRTFPDPSSYECAKFKAHDTASPRVNTINIVSTEHFAARDLGQAQGCAELFSMPNSVESGQNSRTNFVKSSSELYAPQSKVQPISDNQDPSIAVRDFAVTSPVVLGPERIQTNKLEDPKSTIGRFQLDSSELNVHSMPSILSRSATVAHEAPRKLPNPMDHLVKDFGTSRLRPCSTVDVELESSDCNMTELQHDIYLDQRSHGSKHTSSSTAISSPYFPRNESFISGQHNGEEMMPLAQTPSGILGRQSSHHLVEDVKGAGTCHMLGSWKLPTASASQLLLESGMTAIAHPPSQLRAFFPSAEWVQQPSHPCSRSSSTFQAQRGTPVTIFSTPPRRFEGTQTVSNHQKASPYFPTDRPR